MSRENNLIAQIEQIPWHEKCPNCGCFNSRVPKGQNLLDQQMGRWVIDIYPGKWLECIECGTTWKPAKEIEDENRNRDREDTSI